MPAIQKIFNSLIGKWRLQRSVSRVGTAIGEALFKQMDPDNHILHYLEQGQFTNTRKQTYFFNHEYLYHLINNEKKEEQITVYFVENDAQRKKTFYCLHFEPITSHFKDPIPTATSVHYWRGDPCKIRYDFLNPRQFNVTTEVKGPNQFYISTTSFERLD